MFYSYIINCNIASETRSAGCEMVFEAALTQIYEVILESKLGGNL
jgi:hypothetical protein